MFSESVEGGIERVTCRPAAPRHGTPILFVHGMWHGAWCWRGWQALFAEKGWESIAFSLPGHGASERRGSVRFATMESYLSVLEEEIARLSSPPIVIGHSMGGALIQWRLKKAADDLPAAVLLASWTAHSTFADGTALHLKRDPLGFMAMGFTWSTRPLIRTPERAASMLLGDGAEISAEALHAKLCDESYLVLTQHNPPTWTPKKDVQTPLLWIAAEQDAVITLNGARRSAAFYGADFITAPGGHDLMFERSNADTAARIDAWLAQRVPGA